MKFWQAVTLSQMDQYCELAKIAEEIGFTGVSLGEHLVTPRVSKSNSKHPYSDAKVSWPWEPDAPFPDPWQVISIMALVTKTLKFMTSIYILPLHDVFSAAKAISTAAVISDNRVGLCAGVGWLKDEFELTGQNFGNRGARSQEMVEVISRLLEGGMVEHHGKFYDFPPVQMSPVPSRPVPMIMAGDSDAAMRRAVLVDGWMSGLDDVSMLPGLLQKLKAMRIEAGRDQAPFEMIALLRDTPDLDLCLHLQDLGVTAIMLRSWYTIEVPTSPLDYKRKTMEDFSENVISKMN